MKRLYFFHHSAALSRRRSSSTSLKISATGHSLTRPAGSPAPFFNLFGPLRAPCGAWAAAGLARCSTAIFRRRLVDKALARPLQPPIQGRLVQGSLARRRLTPPST